MSTSIPYLSINTHSYQVSVSLKSLHQVHFLLLAHLPSKGRTEDVQPCGVRVTGRVHFFKQIRRSLGLGHHFNLFFLHGRNALLKEIYFGNVVALSLRACCLFLIMGVQFGVVPRNSRRLYVNPVLKGGKLGFGVRQIQPDDLSFGGGLEAEEIGALEWEGFVDVGESELLLTEGHSEDVGTVGVVLIFGDVVVNKGHFFFGHG